MNRSIAVGGAALLAVILGAVVVLVLLLPDIEGAEPERTAAFFPEDSIAYGWISFSPGVGQGRRMLDLWKRLDGLPRVRDAVDELLDDLEDETRIDLEQDLLPWIGPDLSYALLAGSLDPDQGSAEVVALIGVKDHAAASAFLLDLRRLMADDGAPLVHERDIDGFELWAGRDPDTALALSADWFLVATAVEALHQVIERIADGDRPSLADNARFQKARSALPEDRAASLYVDLEAAGDQIASLSGTGADALSEMSGVGFGTDLPAAGGLGAPRWLAVSLGFVERGVAIDAVIPSQTPLISGFEPSFRLADDPGRLLPADTLFLAAGSFEPDMDQWRAELSKYTVAELDNSGALSDFFADPAADGDGEREIDADSSLAEVLDYGLELIDEAIDLELETEFFDLLGGQAAIAVRAFEFERVEDTERYAVDVIATLSYLPGGADGLIRTLDRLLWLLEDGLGDDFPAAAEREIGAEHAAVVFDLEEILGRTAYAPGYVLHQGQLTIGSTERALRAVVAAQNGARASLAEAPQYRRARDALPDRLQGLIFVDLQRVVAGLNPEALDLGPDLYEDLQSVLGAVAVGVSLDAQHVRLSIALTLFPE